jgi:hypothetical protein
MVDAAGVGRRWWICCGRRGQVPDAAAGDYRRGRGGVHRRQTPAQLTRGEALAEEMAGKHWLGPILLAQDVVYFLCSNVI